MRSFRLTGRGWQVLVVGVLAYLGARLFGTTQIYQLSFALLALLGAAFVLAFLGGREIGVSRRVPEGSRLMAGHRSKIEVSVSNGGWVPSPPLEVTDRLPHRETFRVRRVRGRGKVSTSVAVEFPRRGVYELGPAELHLNDPFGLVRLTRRFVERSKVVVYPEVFDLVDFPLGSRSVEDAGARGRALRSGDEFFGLREYRRGDDPRHIHWKSVARTGELLVKEFAASTPRRYTVALDLRRPARGGSEREVEDAISAAGSVLRHFVRERLESRLLTNDRAGSSTDFDGSEDGYWAAMELLATIRADGERRLREVLLAGRERLGDGVVLVTRETGEQLVDLVQRLQARGMTVVMVQVAAHTYRAMRRHDEQVHESEFVATVGRLIQMGVGVRTIRYSGGVDAGLNGAAAIRGAV